jgi:predicted metal-dependent hydrolase
VVHELAHIKHFNHSAAFWRLVATVMPDYLQRRTWLKQQTILVW